FDLLVGPKASSTDLVLNTIFHIKKSPGNIPYRLYEDMTTHTSTLSDGRVNPYRGKVAWAIPYAVGDSYQGRRIVGTLPQLFGVDDEGKPLTDSERIPQYRKGLSYSFAEGRAFTPNKFEAVIGWDVAKSLGMKIGSTFQATHGVPTADFVPFD